MYGFKISFSKRRRFSISGLLIQFFESLNILIKEKRITWMPYYHVSFYVESIDLWFDANVPKVKILTDKEYNEKYKTIKTYDFSYIVPNEAKAWLMNQSGRRYSFWAIVVTLKKILLCWFGLKVKREIDQNKTFICTELVLKALCKCGFYLDDSQIEITTINETKNIVENIWYDFVEYRSKK